MIPDIGLMVGTYIVTRMLEIVLRRDSKDSYVLVAFAIFTILIAVVGVADLLLRGSTGVSLPELAR